ncbi:MAG TPA: ABC transporter ATP-binding protein [Bryobacteraceae bacterium]|jgi:ABC-2 type transport system ATP-binding protein
MIQAIQLTRRFDKLTAVDHVNFEVQKGEIVGLVGPDGAGKTTTMRMLAGMMDPTEGEILIAGRKSKDDPDWVKDQIGYMAQRFGLYQDLTVDENMIFYSDLFGIQGHERDRLMLEYLQMTRMEPFRKRPAGKLSGGMKQKLALMCTLLHRPQILFLDEPTNGVDPVSRRDFWAILYRLVKDGLTVLVSTAYLDEAERCNRVGLMSQGRLIAMDTPRAVKQMLPERCYEVRARDQRGTREALSRVAGVLSAEASGGVLHVFAEPSISPESLIAPFEGATIQPISPSLEDVFIAMMRREERHNAHA